MISQLLKYEKSDVGDLVFSYNGHPSSKMINLIIQLVESKLESTENNARTRKRIINILIEVLQNIFHHHEEFTILNFNSLSFYLFKSFDNYLLVSGNYLRKEKANGLMDKLQNFASLSGNDLREVYLQTLENGEFSPKGGAGLGIMDIIRKSGGNLVHQFIPVDDDHYFFLIEIKINTEFYE